MCLFIKAEKKAKALTTWRLGIRKCGNALNSGKPLFFFGMVSGEGNESRYMFGQCY